MNDYNEINGDMWDEYEQFQREEEERMSEEERAAMEAEEEAYWNEREYEDSLRNALYDVFDDDYLSEDDMDRDCFSEGF